MEIDGLLEYCIFIAILHTPLFTASWDYIRTISIGQELQFIKDLIRQYLGFKSRLSIDLQFIRTFGLGIAFILVSNFGRVPQFVTLFQYF